jgi:hypothetical protein
MKVIVGNESTPKGRPFPKLMVSEEGTIVLMEKEGYGAVIAPKDAIGTRTHTGWAMVRFRDFDGSITLSND